MKTPLEDAKFAKPANDESLRLLYEKLEVDRRRNKIYIGALFVVLIVSFVWLVQALRDDLAKSSLVEQLELYVYNPTQYSESQKTRAATSCEKIRTEPDEKLQPKADIKEQSRLGRFQIGSNRQNHSTSEVFLTPDEIFEYCEGVLRLPDRNGRVPENFSRSELRAYAMRNIEWGFSDGGARFRYAFARLRGDRPFEALIYYVQAHNEHAYCSLIALGRREVGEMICALGRMP